MLRGIVYELKVPRCIECVKYSSRMTIREYGAQERQQALAARRESEPTSASFEAGAWLTAAGDITPTPAASWPCTGITFAAHTPVIPTPDARKRGRGAGSTSSAVAHAVAEAHPITHLEQRGASFEKPVRRFTGTGTGSSHAGNPEESLGALLPPRRTPRLNLFCERPGQDPSQTPEIPDVFARETRLQLDFSLLGERSIRGLDDAHDLHLFSRQRLIRLAGGDADEVRQFLAIGGGVEILPA